MLKLFVCFAAFALISFVVADYDFQDSEFNELIFSDLMSEIEDKPLRFRRGTDHTSEKNQKKKKQGKDVHCCSGEAGDVAAQEAAKEVKEKCIAEIRSESGTDDDELGYYPLSCEGVQAMREKTLCAAECIVKKLNLLDSNGDFNRDALLNHTRKLVGESKWKAPVVEEYVDACLSSLKTATTTVSTPVTASTLEAEKKSDEKSSTCSAAPLELHHCMWKKFVEGCPVESQINSQKCRKMRERLARGDTSHADKSFKKLFKRH